MWHPANRPSPSTPTPSSSLPPQDCQSAADRHSDPGALCVFPGRLPTRRPSCASERTLPSPPGRATHRGQNVTSRLGLGEPLFRAAIAKLADMRLTLYSNGPGSVSSKSLRSNNSSCFGDAQSEVRQVGVPTELRAQPGHPRGAPMERERRDPYPPVAHRNPGGDGCLVPAIIRLCPSFRGARVLDFACGHGPPTLTGSWCHVHRDSQHPNRTTFPRG
jgi:hypothetical protein